jgi:hypothetical protein
MHGVALSSPPDSMLRAPVEASAEDAAADKPPASVPELPAEELSGPPPLPSGPGTTEDALAPPSQAGETPGHKQPLWSPGGQVPRGVWKPPEPNLHYPRYASALTLLSMALLELIHFASY